MSETLLGSVLDLENLRRMVDERYISVKKHPTEDLYILDYSPQAQYAEMWNEETLTCRGLIVRSADGPFSPDAVIHARPFRKFFNVSQHVPEESAPVKGNGARAYTPGPLPVEPFEVFAKMDGSMGVLSVIAGEPTITTRGSFLSEQAQWATRFLRENHPAFVPPDGITCIFEIVYRSNRIVVDYGDFEGLVLLAAIENATGRDVPLPVEWDGPVVERFDFDDFAALSALVERNPEEYYNSEGFVVRFASGVRAKMKFAEYVRLHRIVTGISNKTVYQHLGVARLRDDFDDKQIGRALGLDPKEVAAIRSVPDPVRSLIEECPDEMFGWLDSTLQEYERNISLIVSEAERVLATLPRDDRRAAAELVRTSGAHAGVLFKMLDGRPFLDLVFKDIRPTYSKPYKVDTDS